mmetsp:Transcript_10192/g.22970  ORF Transcript_10192/g.22970 Transcript_10192/m.22970 type:complete len:213 (-) Transcript_10192:771-1409(-)
MASSVLRRRPWIATGRSAGRRRRGAAACSCRGPAADRLHLAHRWWRIWGWHRQEVELILHESIRQLLHAPTAGIRGVRCIRRGALHCGSRRQLLVKAATPLAAKSVSRTRPSSCSVLLLLVATCLHPSELLCLRRAGLQGILVHVSCPVRIRGCEGLLLDVPCAAAGPGAVPQVLLLDRRRRRRCCCGGLARCCGVCTSLSALRLEEVLRLR